MIIKESQSDSLKKNENFMNKLKVLLQGYLQMGIACENIGKETTYRSTLTTSRRNQNPIDFYKNGLKLSKKFLGDCHQITLKFMTLLEKCQVLLEKGYISSESEDPELDENKEFIETRLARLLDTKDELEKLDGVKEMKHESSDIGKAIKPNSGRYKKSFIIKKNHFQANASNVLIFNYNVL